MLDEFKDPNEWVAALTALDAIRPLFCRDCAQALSRIHAAKTRTDGQPGQLSNTDADY